MLFTPYENTKSSKRIRMNISKADMAKFDKLPSKKNKKTITIKNLKNGKKYVIRRADCGAGCYCAAEVVKIVKPTKKILEAPKKSKRILRGKRNSPSTSATSVNVGTKRRGGDGKMYVCKTYKRGNKRVKRWFKV